MPKIAPQNEIASLRGARHGSDGPPPVKPTGCFFGARKLPPILDRDRAPADLPRHRCL